MLEAALGQVIANGGAPGVDGMRVEELARDEGIRERWLAKLESDLRGKTYRPSPVRRVYIPKADGKKRPLGIPTVRDRVVQTAVVLLLLPIFEADFHEKSYAYRPKRRAHQAIDAIKVALLSGRREVVDADLSGYFDTIPHAALMRLVKGRVSDGSILSLIKGWLRAAIREETARSTLWKEPEEVIARVNRRTRGWIGYFHYANSAQVFGNMERQLRERMRRWLWKKRGKTRAHYGDHYSNERLHNHYGLVHFPLHTTWQSA